MTTRKRPWRGRTYEPWPCYGEPPEEHGRRTKGAICSECKGFWAMGVAARQREADGAKTATYAWPARADEWPGYNGEYRRARSHTAVEPLSSGPPRTRGDTPYNLPTKPRNERAAPRARECAGT